LTIPRSTIDLIVAVGNVSKVLAVTAVVMGVYVMKEVLFVTASTTASSPVEGNLTCVPTVRDPVKVVPTPVTMALSAVVVTVPCCAFA
jgi:hypothetical protein